MTMKDEDRILGNGRGICETCADFSGRDLARLLYSLSSEQKARITTVVLTGTDTGDAEFAMLEILPNLKRLYVSGTRLTDVGIISIARHRLEVFIADDTAISDHCFEELMSIKTLKELGVRETSLSLWTLLRLANSSPLLGTIWFTGTEREQQQIANAIELRSKRFVEAVCCCWYHVANPRACFDFHVK